MNILCAAVLVLFIFSVKAFAYIDPGAGSMMLQVVIGGAIGAIYWFRGIIGSVIGKIFKKKK